MDLERSPGCVGRLLAPQLVDETIARDRLVRVEQEEGKEAALFRASELHVRSLVVHDLDRPENAELHALLDLL